MKSEMKDLLPYQASRDNRFFGLSESAKPDIVAAVSTHVELKQRGRHFWGCCPFHSEKTPSFKVDPENQNFHCFGCGAHGDVIAFIEKHKGLSFADTLTYLGMRPGKLDRETRQRIDHEKQKRQAVAVFRQWCNSYYGKLADFYRMLQQAKSRCRTWTEVERIAPLYHAESVWTLHMEILTGCDDRAKFDIYREVKQNA